jgi:hypothetical protein
MPEGGIRGSSRGGQRTYAVSATPIMKTSHATNQDERHPGLRKLIPPPEAVVLPIIGRTPTPTVPRTVSARAIFVQADIRHLSLHWVIVTRIGASNAARCVECHGVRSHPVPVALVGECSIPVV